MFVRKNFNIAWFRLLKLPKADWTTQCHFHWAGAKHFGNLPLTLNTLIFMLLLVQMLSELQETCHVVEASVAKNIVGSS